MVEHRHQAVAADVRAGVELVAAELRARRRLSPESEARVLALLARFGAFVGRGFSVECLDGVSAEHVGAFVQAPTRTGALPSVATMRLRRSAVRLLFRTARELDLASGDPTVDLVLPSRTNKAARPLTDDEVAFCRRECLSDLVTTRLSVAWAFGEATARTAEIPRIAIRDVDLANRRVWLAGSAKTERRWGALTEWGTQQVGRHLRALGEVSPDTLVAYTGRGNLESRRSFSCQAIRETLERAGLTDDRSVRAASLTAWAGATMMRATSRIDIVASALGVRSLDAAATMIGWDWTATSERGDE